MKEFIKRLTNCVDNMNMNQSEEIDLEDALWESIDICENNTNLEGFSQLEDQLETLDTICDTMIDNLKEIKKTVNSIQEWE